MIAALALAQSAAAAEVCAFPDPPRVIAQSGNPHAPGSRLLQVWQMADAPVWWSPAEPKGYAAFRAQVAARAGPTDPAFLLAQDPSPNNRLVAANAAQWIAPVNCLEMLLQQTQNQRIGVFDASTEFTAVVLRSADGKRLRVYFYTINADGIGRASPVSDPAAADSRAGWKVVAALHNHAFHPGQPALNAPLAPSKPDAQFNANYAARAGMAEAWITNGLQTAHIPAAAFDRFERDGPPAAPAACPPGDAPAITATAVAALPDGRQGRPYPPRRIVTGGTAPYAACRDPGLPPGLAVLPSGQLTGTSRAAGDFRFVVLMSDASTPPLILRQAFHLRILGARNPPPPATKAPQP